MGDYVLNLTEDQIVELSAAIAKELKDIHSITELPTNTGWISVKDRLPQNPIYLGCCGDFLVTDGKHQSVAGWTQTYDPINAISYWRWVAGTVNVDLNEITHWMPLPEPPK